MRHDDELSRGMRWLADRPDDAGKTAFARAAAREWARSKPRPSASADEVADYVAADFTAAMHEIRNAIDVLEHSPLRRLELRQFIDSVGPRIARDCDFPRHLIAGADRAEWPTWAVECLPSLFVRDETRPGECGRALVWHYILDCVDSKHRSIQRTLCGGCVLDVELPGEILVLLDQLAPTFEECRLRRPCASLESMTDCVIRILKELDDRRVPRAAALNERFLRGLYQATLSVDPDRKPELVEELHALQARQTTFPKWALATLSAA